MRHKSILLLCAVFLMSFSINQNSIYSKQSDISDSLLIVKTKYGFVKGKKDKHNTIVWKGIPYAKPPIGNLRWKAPVEPEAWEGILVTRKFSNSALQFKPMSERKIFGKEDCLYLNIWKPASANETKLPVYVWIHGGGNSTGSAGQISEYYGHAIANRSKVIFVSVNYRLGPFGWLSHPSLRNSDNKADDSGNYGTLDIIHSLKWIKENIEAFGGDPEKVMITGESAGGINVLSLMISPQAEGLFSCALCQSGLPKIGKIKDSEVLTEKIITDLMIKQGSAENIPDAKKKLSLMNNAEIREFLYKQDAEDILKSVDPYLMGMLNMPFIFPDGHVIPKKGYGVLETGENVNNVPLMIGSNTDEMKLFIYFSKEPKPKDRLYNTIAKYGSDMWKATGVDRIAQKLSKIPGQAPVYVYLFNFGHTEEDQESSVAGKWGHKLGAHHAAEIKYFLGTDKRRLAILSLTNKNSFKKGRQDLSETMMTYTRNLLYKLDPNRLTDELPAWNAWSDETEIKGIIFDANTTEATIKNLNYELFPENILKEMKDKLNKNEIDKVKEFMFIFE